LIPSQVSSKPTAKDGSAESWPVSADLMGLMGEDKHGWVDTKAPSQKDQLKQQERKEPLFQTSLQALQRAGTVVNSPVELLA